MTCSLAVLPRLEQSISVMVPLGRSAQIAAWPGSHHLSHVYDTHADFDEVCVPDAEKMLQQLPPEFLVSNGE